MADMPWDCLCCAGSEGDGVCLVEDPHEVPSRVIWPQYSAVITLQVIHCVGKKHSYNIVCTQPVQHKLITHEH